ncbi:hypothetical protein [Methanolacinia petrolearia]|uniref:hypothetical protein n=1 Tax=Methanolacinia petrolearia TaxID=54120 RepID=UPI003BABAD56
MVDAVRNVSRSDITGKKNDIEVEKLVKKLSSSEVLERGDNLNKKFNDFSIGELLKPFNI